jgi:hypothetical protein
MTIYVTDCTLQSCDCQQVVVDGIMIKGRLLRRNGNDSYWRFHEDYEWDDDNACPRGP